MLSIVVFLLGDVEFTGSVATRDQATFVSEDSLVSTRDVPALLSQNELNLQARATLLEDKLRFGGDASAFVFLGGLYADADKGGELAAVDDHKTAATTPFIALSEYWASAAPAEWLVVTLGKKRTTWGPGVAFSPTDLLNPLRDPTDPSLQRAGFLQARVDVPLEQLTLTALVAPRVLETTNAIPTRVLVDENEEAHWAAALRAYALVGEADVNGWVLVTQRYGDAVEDRPRLAFTVAQTLFTTHELHLEVLLQQGTSRPYATPECTTGLRSLQACALQGRPFFDATKLDDHRLFPRVLTGWRWMPDDGSMLSLEYLYQADGYLRSEYDDVQRLLGLFGEVQRAGAPPPAAGGERTSASGNTSVGEAPTRFAFVPVRRHYLFFSYTKPQINDDFTVQATLITPLEDLSLLVQGSLVWQAREWLQLSVLGFLPLPSPARISAEFDDDPWQAFTESVDPDWRRFVPRGAVVNGVPVGEYDALPFRARAMFEARAFF